MNLPNGGGGTADYDALTNKPKINGVELSGDKSAGDLRILPNSGNETTDDFEMTRRSVAVNVVNSDEGYNYTPLEAIDGFVKLQDNYTDEIVIDEGINIHSANYGVNISASDDVNIESGTSINLDSTDYINFRGKLDPKTGTRAGVNVDFESSVDEVNFNNTGGVYISPKNGDVGITAQNGTVDIGGKDDNTFYSDGGYAQMYSRSSNGSEINSAIEVGSDGVDIRNYAGVYASFGTGDSTDYMEIGNDGANIFIGEVDGGEIGNILLRPAADGAVYYSKGKGSRNVSADAEIATKGDIAALRSEIMALLNER